jgi:hypothetical protein
MGDLDRRKHDVDVIERVLGELRDTDAAEDDRTRVIDVDVPGVSSRDGTLELTIASTTPRPTRADDHKA